MSIVDGVQQMFSELMGYDELDTQLTLWCYRQRVYEQDKRNWRAQNIDIASASARRWRAQNIERARLTTKQWRAKSIEAARAADRARYHARKARAA